MKYLTIITARKRSCGMVMFSQASVRGEVGLVTSNASLDRGSPLDIRPGDLTPPQTSDLETYPMLVACGNDHWRPVHTCLFGDLSPRVTSGGGHRN